MNVSSWINHQVTLYSYIKTNMHLIYKNAFKRCINTCTFHDNLLFLICSVDGLNQILEYLLIYMFYLFSACTCIFVWDLMPDLVTCKIDKDPIKNERASVETIRILHGREVQIEKSVTRVTIWAASWQNQQNDCAPSEDSDQPGHPRGLIKVFAVRMKKARVLS